MPIGRYQSTMRSYRAATLCQFNSFTQIGKICTWLKKSPFKPSLLRKNRHDYSFHNASVGNSFAFRSVIPFLKTDRTGKNNLNSTCFSEHDRDVIRLFCSFHRNPFLIRDQIHVLLKQSLDPDPADAFCRNTGDLIESNNF